MAVCFPKALGSWFETAGWFLALPQTAPTALHTGAGIVYNSARFFSSIPPSSISDVSLLALLCGAGWLFYKKIFNWKTPSFFFISFSITLFLFHGIVPQSFFSGGIVFAGFYLLTDYETSPISSLGKVFYGIISGILIAFVHLYSPVPDSVCFMIILLNASTSFLDNLGLYFENKANHILYQEAEFGRYQ